LPSGPNWRRNAAANNYLENYLYKNTNVGDAFTNLPDWYDFIARKNRKPQTARELWDAIYHPKPLAGGGGVGTDTVPAMLTPGEWVIPEPVASKLGGSFLHAVNNMQIPMPAIPRFAMGGPVGTVPSLSSSTVLGGITVNIHGAPADFANESAIRRLLIPAIRNIQRRT